MVEVDDGDGVPEVNNGLGDEDMEDTEESGAEENAATEEGEPAAGGTTSITTQPLRRPTRTRTVPT